MAARGTLPALQPEAPQVSRRVLLRTAAIGAAVGASGVAPALLGAGRASAIAGPRTFVSTDLDLHMLGRATYGLTPGSVKKIQKMGRNAWLDQQLAPETIDDSACEALIAGRFPDLSLNIYDAVRKYEGGWDLLFQLGMATIARASWSKRQLFEVMVDFWSNHLNVTNPSDNVWGNRHDYDRNVIRKHALGKFSDMLAASATHPAMMLYLNNAESTRYAPNENYGRELLELHSVGVEGGYDETDMRQSALIMTGFGIDWDTYEFHYWKDYHHTGPVQVMGWSSPNGSATGGLAVGLSYVDYLAHHPSTAHRIAYKLCRRFVSDVPDETLVSSLAATYLANDTAIVPVLRQLLRSTGFRASVGSKVRRPFEDLIATMRILGIKADVSGTEGMQGLYWIIDSLGHLPMGWHQPDGYPDFADAWRSAGGTLGRWNMHVGLAAHWWPDTLVLPDLRTNLLPAVLPSNYGLFVQALAQRLVNQPLGAQHKAAVLGFLGKSSTDRVRESDEAVRWRLPYVVALILDSPYHMTR